MEHLDGKHTIFGEVAEGFETLAKLNELYVDENGRPFQDVRIKHTYVLDDPFDDPTQLEIPPQSPDIEYPTEERVVRRIPYEEGIVDAAEEGRTTAELEESIRRKEAESRAIVLEMTGDIPDAEVKPPTEALFVCKLNPVTTDADLELIFSRFGKIKECAIVRDFKTGDSLNYAFIEFETEDAVLEAYEKMNNVLIDDRRIKVDFSQSVAKLWNKYLLRPRDNKSKGDSSGGHSRPADGGDRGRNPDVHKSAPPLPIGQHRDNRQREERRNARPHASSGGIDRSRHRSRDRDGDRGGSRSGHSSHSRSHLDDHRGTRDGGNDRHNRSRQHRSRSRDRRR